MATKTEYAEPLVVERTFDASLEKVWKAITNADEMRRWHFDLKDFKAECGFEFQFVVEHEGNTYDHRCKVMEVIPQRKIAYTWRYEGHEGDSLVTFELFVDGDKTRLKLTHEGLESFPKTPAFARKNFEQGWISIIGDSLKDFVKNIDREISR
jgi:uncharacterized protein YndB with AHSA1/START domain